MEVERRMNTSERRPANIARETPGVSTKSISILWKDYNKKLELLIWQISSDPTTIMTLGTKNGHRPCFYSYSSRQLLMLGQYFQCKQEKNYLCWNSKKLLFSVFAELVINQSRIQTAHKPLYHVFRFMNFNDVPENIANGVVQRSWTFTDVIGRLSGWCKLRWHVATLSGGSNLVV